MRKPECIAAAVISSMMSTAAIGQVSANSTADVAQLKSLGCEMGRAYASQDLAALDELNAEDYVQTDTRGVVVTHAEYPEYVRQRTGPLIHHGVSSLSIDCDDIEVRLYGDAAVVTGAWTYVDRGPDGRAARRSRWTSMWTRYPTGWKRHAFQNTWVDADASQPALATAANRSGIGAHAAAGPEVAIAEGRVPPDLQKAIEALAGSWSVSEEYPRSPLYPEGGIGRGTEVWRAGPGGITLAYEYHSTNPHGEMWATAVLWWDSAAKRLRELWCTGQSRKGCVLSTADIRWENDDLVFSDTYDIKGRRVHSREVWSQLQPDSHTMTISDSGSNGAFKPWIVSHAVRTVP